MVMSRVEIPNCDEMEVQSILAGTGFFDTNLYPTICLYVARSVAVSTMNEVMDETTWNALVRAWIHEDYVNLSLRVVLVDAHLNQCIPRWFVSELFIAETQSIVLTSLMYEQILGYRFVSRIHLRQNIMNCYLVALGILTSCMSFIEVCIGIYRRQTNFNEMHFMTN